jgi:hypothetical protein
MIEAMLRRIERLELSAREFAANVGWFEQVTRTDPVGDEDSVAGMLDGNDYQFPARRVETWGFRGRPVVGVLGLLVRAIAGTANGALVGIATRKYGPTDLAEGESAQYSKANPKAVLADKDGNTQITSVDSGKVLINGGGKGAALKDHKVGNGTLVIAFVPGTGGASLSVTYNPGDGSPPQVVNGAGGTITLKEKIVEGSASIEFKED